MHQNMQFKGQKFSTEVTHPPTQTFPIIIITERSWLRWHNVHWGGGTPFHTHPPTRQSSCLCHSPPMFNNPRYARGNACQHYVSLCFSLIWSSPLAHMQYTMHNPQRNNYISLLQFPLLAVAHRLATYNRHYTLKTLLVFTWQVTDFFTILWHRSFCGKMAWYV